jgi:GntR family transcriptional regulator
MTFATDAELFHPDAWYRPGHGPRYEQLYRYLAAAIADGTFAADTQLPPERELAEIAMVSRVTVRKAVAQLVEENVLEQRRGAGTFVKSPRSRMDHSLSTLTSFTEYMRQRGRQPTSQILNRGLFQPIPMEQQALGITAPDRVARIERLRSADGVAMAIEWSSLPADILPDPDIVQNSLYDVLRAGGRAPTRAVQRISAVMIKASEARLLDLPMGSAVLRIERTGYLPSGRPIEYTRGLYRSDIYDFVAELRLEENL